MIPGTAHTWSGAAVPGLCVCVIVLMYSVREVNIYEYICVRVYEYCCCNIEKKIVGQWVVLSSVSMLRFTEEGIIQEVLRILELV